ncbi:hypothetical protein BT96DRAFT_921966 [Gymnopus androsaceus JB14]|uniref:DUF6593 domain-containing protein n=1 Tax=Gymnopus androsaceus JB14 TaxID=1447944 RepID=A0A6A4HE67_9AGAR|nr:hypothetical protein BT96DRAFT_921966 [Gymnopus androsaceus JB14]
MSNPFASWASTRGSGDSAPSVFGALPAAFQTTTSDFMTFYFTSLNTTILNCTLTGPNGQPHFYIATDSSLPGYTVFRTPDGRNVALVEWNPHGAQVEIRGALQKQLASQFIRLSPDRRFRIMSFGGQDYAWVPRDNTICMYRVSSSHAACLAKLSKEHGTMKLEVSPTAVQNGLLLPSALTVMLLQSGQRID